jgi:hypothetical protein
MRPEAVIGAVHTINAYADRRFNLVTDESNIYRKFTCLTIYNIADRCVRLITAGQQGNHEPDHHERSTNAD